MSSFPSRSSRLQRATRTTWSRAALELEHLHRDLVVRVDRPRPGIEHHPLRRDQEGEVLRQHPGDGIRQRPRPLVKIGQGQLGATRPGDNLRPVQIRGHRHRADSQREVALTRRRRRRRVAAGQGRHKVKLASGGVLPKQPLSTNRATPQSTRTRVRSNRGMIGSYLLLPRMSISGLRSSVLARVRIARAASSSDPQRMRQIIEHGGIRAHQGGRAGQGLVGLFQHGVSPPRSVSPGTSALAPGCCGPP